MNQGLRSWPGVTNTLALTFGNPPVMRSALDASTSLTVTSGVAYWVYVGQLPYGCVPRYVEVGIRAGGTGAQTAEICIASTPVAPNGAAQVLTRIEATGTITALTGTTVPISNTTAFSTWVAAGTHLWAGVRTAMASTQPMFHALFDDKLQGYVLSTAASGVLTSTSVNAWTGSLVAYSSTNGAVCPALTVRI